MTENIRVLLIEDDQEDYLLTRDLLEAITTARFTLDWEPTYGGARAALAGDRYDVCLVDYRLGRRCGIDLLQEANESGCRAPLIILTGQDDRAADLGAMKAGAADYLLKEQITPALLERSIRYAIERKRCEL
jgi:two-component system cell cycle sensor histidine kinase/response regulator CckA